MNTDQTIKNIFYTCCILLLLAACSKHVDTGSIKERNGFSENIAAKVNFPISCSAQAQSSFVHALALMHHMMYVQAEKEFTAITKQEPDCAMAQWGIAMTLFHPLWPGATGEADLNKGAAAVQKARSLKTATIRELAYIDAVAAFYQDRDTKDHATRIALWAQAQQALYKQYPEDYEAAVLYALSYLATAPKADSNFSHQQEAGVLLEELNEIKPGHPGVLHYTIHAYDNPMLATRAINAAYAYDKIAPDVPHALHMPTHIFVRLGKWPEVIDLNARSSKAALKYPANGYISHHYPHALDYELYGYLQLGADAEAKAVLQELNSKDHYQQSFVSGYALAAMTARYQLERGQWEKAANLALRNPASFPWDRFPEIEAMSYYARGLGAVRSGDLKSAQQARVKLDSLYARTADKEQKYWTLLVDVQRKTITAWIDFAKGDKAPALKLMRVAADLEDSVNKHPVTPGAIVPARELLGDMLLQAGKPEKALAEYEQVLEITPNRFNSLYGAGYAAELAGQSGKAKLYYSQLVQSGVQGKNSRLVMKHAQSFLAKN